MTHQIRNHERPSSTKGRMINQYEFVHRVGKGQHGDVYLARDTTKGNMDVVSILSSLYHALVMLWLFQVPLYSGCVRSRGFRTGCVNSAGLPLSTLGVGLPTQLLACPLMQSQ